MKIYLNSTYLLLRISVGSTPDLDKKVFLLSAPKIIGIVTVLFLLLVPTFTHVTKIKTSSSTKVL